MNQLTIDLHRTDSDDPEFLEIAARCTRAALHRSDCRELYVVLVKNWLDSKWRGFSGKASVPWPSRLRN